ncbi:Histone H2AZ-specific chaperone CHZ1 [Nakaseomyces bracarensis]|uniref:Histone H2A.Z-specific chaperone CHZ1 n=1 Tax=Nakaseomyces bracarensis TaxID=273131 RepID=A0ABR4NSZ0_9SACH
MVEEKVNKVEETTAPVEAPAEAAVAAPVEKKKRRRRNYDDYDAEVAASEKNKKKNKVEETASTVEANGAAVARDSDSESEVDDAKLDRLVNEDEEEDDLAEIDTSNIITTGRRTRGKIIDYKKTAKELDEQPKEEEEEDDGDFNE